jgi:diguanylate cyclase (GGDEF)-like protein
VEVSAHTSTLATDSLTGLLGRASFLDRLRQLCDEGRALAVLFLDLDDFKLINDGFGHDTGDRLLLEVAARLREAVRPEDVVARLGGDEFTVLCEGIHEEADALEVARRLHGALAEPFTVAGQRRQVRASIGCRVAGRAGDADELLRDADVAMYQAKNAGKDRVELFSETTRRLIVRRLALEQDLRAALAADELEVHFQPQVEIATGRVVGAEALARWPHRDEGYVPPLEFVGVAEETGLIVPLGAWVLDEACRRLSAWRAAGVAIPITVNLSTHQLGDPELVERVRASLTRWGIPPSAICLELTESALMGAGEAPLHRLEELKALGLYLAVDDFGTGYSSLGALKRLPVEVLKVDRSFVDGLGTDPDDSAIVAAVLSLAHALGLHVVAEGVESELQASQLTALGCPVAQGFLFSPAVPAEAFPALVARMGAARSRRRRRPAFRGERALIDEMMHQIGIPREAL